MSCRRLVFSFAAIKAEVYIFKELKRNFPPHFHDMILAGMLLNGGRKLRFGGREKAARPGDLVILPPRIVHSCSAWQSEDCDWIGMHLRAEKTEDFEPVFINNSRAGVLLARLAACLSSGTALAEDFPQKLKSEILALANVSPRLDTPRARFRGLRDYLESRSSQKIGLAEMANFAKLRKTQLIRNFVKLTGATPYRYFENLRLFNAQRLLRQGESLAACAAEAGYCDQSHLNRAFDANLGVPPGFYRKSWLGGESC